MTSPDWTDTGKLAVAASVENTTRTGLFKPQTEPMTVGEYISAAVMVAIGIAVLAFWWMGTPS